VLTSIFVLATYIVFHYQDFVTRFYTPLANVFFLVAAHGAALLPIAVYGVESPVELTYLSDSIILLRFFEAFGQVRQAISVLKKRTGGHQRSVREASMEGDQRAHPASGDDCGGFPWAAGQGAGPSKTVKLPGSWSFRQPRVKADEAARKAGRFGRLRTGS